MKFLFVSDATVFGGHERVCMDIARSLARHAKIVFAYSDSNPELRRIIATDASWINAVELRSRHSRGALYFAPFRSNEQREMMQLVETEQPDAIFLFQGRIETCAPQMYALWKSSIPFVSVLPFAHAVQEIKSFAWWRRWENAIRYLYYRTPSAFIVPSEIAYWQLRRRGVTAQVYVLPNVLGTIEIKRSLTEKKILRCIGRIEFLQKRQDQLVRLVALRPELFSDYKLQFVGEGPDSEKLLRLISQLNISHLAEVIGLLPRERVLEDVSVVLMPSRFEGLPLIMLEALAAGIPVIGSDIDVFQRYLPGIAINEFKSPEQLSTTIRAVSDYQNAWIWDNLQKSVIETHSFKKLLDASDDMLMTGIPTLNRINDQ